MTTGDVSSETFTVRTAPDAASLSANLPHQFVVYGDLGHTLPHSSSTIMPFAARDVRSGPPGLPRKAIVVQAAWRAKGPRAAFLRHTAHAREAKRQREQAARGRNQRQTPCEEEGGDGRRCCAAARM